MTPKLLASVALLAAALANVSRAQTQAEAIPSSPQVTTPTTHLAVGIVRSVDGTGREVTIEHQAIPSLNMPAMTMEFRLPAESTLSLKAGQSIAFTFMESADGLTIVSAQPVGVVVAAAGRSRSAPDETMPGMNHEGKEGKRGTKGMMGSCQEMMGNW